MSSKNDQMIPTISITIPGRNEEKDISRALTPRHNQSYPSNLIEVIVADGHSEDKTQQIVAGFEYILPRLNFVENPKKITPLGINQAINYTCGDIIILMSGHSQFAPDYIQRCVEHLLKNDIDAVGGPAFVANSPKDQQNFLKTLHKLSKS